MHGLPILEDATSKREGQPQLIAAEEINGKIAAFKDWKTDIQSVTRSGNGEHSQRSTYSTSVDAGKGETPRTTAHSDQNKIREASTQETTFYLIEIRIGFKIAIRSLPQRLT